MSRTTSGWVRGAAGAALAGLATFVVSVTSWAAGGPPATELVNVADSRGLTGGPGRWVADLYNESLLLYGFAVVVVMVAMGVILGVGFDRAMGLLGISLGKLDHHE